MKVSQGEDPDPILNQQLLYSPSRGLFGKCIDQFVLNVLQSMEV